MRPQRHLTFRRQWVVHEDAILANRLQDNEFERKYNRNLAERQIAKQDVRLARQVQTTDEERVQRTRRHQQQRTRNIVDDDAIIAEQLQSEEFIKKEQERAISELKDEEMARRLQEKEKRRYELRLREKELRKQRKMLEAELKLESNGLRENITSSSVVEMAIAAPARERSPDLEGAVGNDLDFFVPPSGNISGHDRKGLQHLQDEDLARRLQNEEQKLQSKLEKLKEIELRDAELAKIMQEQEHLKMQKRRRGQRPRDTRQSSDPCHASESHLPEARQSHSLPQPHDLPQGNDDPPNNFPFRDVSLPQVGLPDHESGRTGHPARFVSRPLPDTPSPELPRGCNMSLLRALERDADEGLSHRMNVLTSCQTRDARRMPLLLSDDEDLLPPLLLPPPSNAKKSSPSMNANIFAEIDPTWNQGQMRHAEEVPSKSSPGNHRQTESEALEDGYCDLEDVRALRVVMSSDGEDLGMVPGQRRQPFNRNANRASGQKSNCKQQ